MTKLLNLIKKHPYYTVAGIIAVILTFMFIFSSEDAPEETKINELRTVSTIDVANYSKGALGVVVPTAGGNSFVVRAEASGRVDTVNEGTEVSQGDIIAELDNDTQRAALVQAQGAYEAARASGAQSNFNIDTQKEALTSSYNSANTTLRSTAVSVQGVMENTLDTFFTSANRASLELNDYLWEKKLLNYALGDWTELVQTNIPNENMVSELDTAISVTERIANLLDAVYSKVLDEEKNSPSGNTTLSTYKSDLTAAKTTIASNLQSLRSVKLNVVNAQSELKRTESTSIGGDTSAVEAQIKQALGAYQAAQAAYERTVVRAPFDGTLTSVNISVGDIISLGTDVAIIIPEAGVDTTKSFNLPLSAIKYTPDNAYVFVIKENDILEAISVETGLVTANYINVTGLNGDEIIIDDVRGLKAGQHVNTN